LDVSQPTIHRHTRALEAADLIEKEGNEFVLTPVGEIVAEEFTDLFAVVKNVLSLRRVFE